MALTIQIPAEEIDTPSWEPSDSSVRQKDGGWEIYCHYSGRQIATADSGEECELFIERQRLRIAKEGLAKQLDGCSDPDLIKCHKNWWEPRIEWHQSEIAHLEGELA